MVKKGGHMVGYGLLSLVYWRGLGLRSGRQPVAWLLAIAYALTDEFHQTFVPGRHAALIDVALFDNLGAALSLLAYSKIRERIELARSSKTTDLP
jgi:VanZ family protein